MTMHVVLGDGEMTRRELTENLADLWKGDEAEGNTFWFLIQGKSEPTDTDKAMVQWLEKNEIYYELVTDDAESISDIYTAPQETHVAKKLSQKVAALLQSKPEEDEPAEVLALFFDPNDPTAAEDKWLNNVIQAAFEAGFRTRALNDGLVEVDLSEEAAVAEEEPAEEAPAPTKSVAKKAAAPTKKAAPAAEEETPVPTATIPTREELEDMEPSEIKEIAAGLGINLPPRTRATTYIEHILGEAKAAAPTAEIEEVAEVDVVPTNGHLLDPTAIAEAVADLLWDRLQKALSSPN